ncbi:SagB-type dehydrogenase domain protein (plasmid) [Natrialba magadii ATCC 43099]|uniref:SagB-type dehydrogenase domain protein n=1 Tax=Natrialba magadii (strain ATCC 43099 / DSM 3394 / CCM 3739 / CIP 104546 / IAM 13178 / JCM 8861 / NBRC 102185 / NCIMB 2190 / MS3) TaxID=547559 RepID=D3T1T5_NATMM|nr:SagB/ThcOx family dehydrogenase [Natrialba magadii]ADD07544.1 SagB-type dehydrogenase domain protein [Natrialba magadii ATCC 43099]ELY26580.1 SagB-type dehydrogenase domain-containing protein [Natrialba magadii ATCC 43099]
MTRTELPDPETDSTTSVEQAIATRVSRRSFARTPVTTADVSQVLWATQGVTHERDGIEMRAAPSAGATYPIVAFLEVAPDGSERLEAGLYRYEPTGHALEVSLETTVHDDLTRAALSQEVVRDAPATIVLAADYDRTRTQYPDHGDRYVHMEAGHAAENVHLVCESRNLNTCPVGAFSDADVADVLDLPGRLDPLYLLPFGHRRTEN